MAGNTQGCFTAGCVYVGRKGSYESISQLFPVFLQFLVQLDSQLLNFYEPSPTPGVVENTEIKSIQALPCQSLVKPLHTTL